MGTITILKDINKTKENKYNTIEVKICNFTYAESSSGLTLQRQLKNEVATYTGWMDSRGDQYSETITNTWESIFSGGGAMDKINKFLVIAGIGSLKSKAMYSQVWTDSKPTAFKIPMKFIADKDPTTEVIIPIRGLQSMIVPQERTVDPKDTIALNPKTNTLTINAFGGSQPFHIPPKTFKIISDIKSTFFDTILMPPAGSIINLTQLGNKDAVFQGIEHIKIGNFVILRDIVLKNVTASFNIDDCDFGGVPKSASVTLDVESKNIWTNKTIETLQSEKRSDIPGEPEFINIGKIGDDVIKAVQDIFIKQG
jgi:hypothetical protein